MGRSARTSTLVAMVAATTLVLGQGTALAAPLEKADYQFQNTHASSIDAPPALLDIGDGTNSFITDTVDGKSRTVLSWPAANGVALTPTTGVVPNDVYTIVALFRIDDTTGFRKLIDFKGLSADPGLYSVDGHLYFYPVVQGTSVAITAGEYVQVVLTRDSSNHVIGYVDGSQQFAFNDSNDFAVIDFKNTLNFFLDDHITTGEESAGVVARLRVYDSALPANQVSALNRLPPKRALTLNPTSGPPGQQVAVSGKGFAGGESVKLTFVDTTTGAKTALGKATANVNGAFSAMVTVPANASTGADRIQAKGTYSGVTAKKTFTVT
jgi:hypothetical protein